MHLWVLITACVGMLNFVSGWLALEDLRDSNIHDHAGIGCVVVAATVTLLAAAKAIYHWRRETPSSTPLGK